MRRARGPQPQGGRTAGTSGGPHPRPTARHDSRAADARASRHRHPPEPRSPSEPDHATARDSGHQRLSHPRAARASPGELRNAVWTAARLEVLDLHGALRLCNESRGRTGTGLLRRLLLEKRGPVTETRSPLEDLLLPICADFGIRMPLVSVPVLNYVVDFLWLPERLVVELDGWEWHKSRESFEDNRRRDARHGVAGYHVHRATRGRLLGEPKVIAREVLAMLDRLAQSRTAAG